MRVKSPRLARHKKLLARASGYRMTRNRLYKVAAEAVRHAGQYAFAGRHLKRRDLRSTWIVRLNAFLRPLGITYSVFVGGLKKANISLDRRSLAELALKNPVALKQVAKTAGFSFKE